MNSNNISPPPGINCHLFRTHVANEIELENRCTSEQFLICEIKLTVEVNGAEAGRILCIQDDLLFLGLGFLYSEGIVTRREEITSVEISEDVQLISVFTSTPDRFDACIFHRPTIKSACGRCAVMTKSDSSNRPPITSDYVFSMQDIESAWNQVDKLDVLYLQTRGVHSCALCFNGEVVYFNSDIGRHNTVDRIAGKCFWEEINTTDKFLLCSGRFSSEMIQKIAAIGVPMAIGRSAPTDHAVDLANELGITLAQAKSNRRLVVYTHPERLGLPLSLHR